MTKVLYIEDNEDNIYMLKMRLERKGFEVIVARDGLEGYNAALSFFPDIILLDVGLPVMSGYEVATKIKNTSKISHIPIIMLTAHVLSEDRKRALEAGANEYEPKPVNLVDLIQKIEALTSKN